ncbi:hypothetical protein EYF80_041719 [Liparis tanakae]|uniref:Uncharacterized protein n=1 Tax=Liparis tanakae TaxID=230148 RepID=A0A4Z2G5P7_9TELE|nr:hypothetical protein EYF80_041719 [Liparis tanakae]
MSSIELPTVLCSLICSSSSRKLCYPPNEQSVGPLRAPLRASRRRVAHSVKRQIGRRAVWLQPRITSGYPLMPNVTWSLNQGASIKLDATALDAGVGHTDTLYVTVTGITAPVHDSRQCLIQKKKKKKKKKKAP